MSWLGAALAVGCRKSSSVVRRRKHLEITELIRSEEIAFWKKHVSVPIAQDCRGRDGTSHTWCVSMLDARLVTSAEPGISSSQGPGQLGSRLGCALPGRAGTEHGAITSPEED